MLDKLDLSNCTTNEEVSNKIKERVKSVDVETLTEELSKDFIYCEEPIRTVYTALATGKNSILYGPGGFGKSVLVKAICKYLGIPIICKVGYDGMTPEELLGIPNMQKLLNDSTYEVAFENSVFCIPGILLLEEFFDCDPKTAASLKDILTEKGFRERDSKKESLISSVILVGNKTPKDVSIDDSTAAFYEERFPFSYRMIWNHFDENNYTKFFNVYFKERYRKNQKEFLLLAKLCAKTEKQVSPRIAAEAGDVILELGIDFIDTVTGIDTTEIKQLKEEVQLERKLGQENIMLENFTMLISNMINKANDGENDNIEDFFKSQCLLETFRGQVVDEENVPKLLALIELTNRFQQARMNALEELIDLNKFYEKINEILSSETILQL